MNAASRRDRYDVVVIGAGPAGLAATATAAGAGLSTLLLDENAGPGGQVWRSISSTPVKSRAMLGDDYWAGESIVQAARASGAEIIHRATVWSLDRNLDIAVSIGGASAFVKAKRVILATGALERPFPIPGWTLPGVMTAGAAQTMLKSSGLVPDGRTIIAGQGPLLWLLAAQILRLGGRIDRVLDTAHGEARFRALPKLLAQPGTLAKGLHYTIWLRARGIPLWDAIQPIEILGGTSTAGLRFRDRTGAEREIQGDAVAMGFGLKPETQLADLAGCAFGFDEASRQFLPLRDGEGRAHGAAGVYLAGDGAGIAGADAAELAGEQAALTLLADQGMAVSSARRREIAARLARIGRFRQGLEAAFAFPAELARSLPDAAILCRCEAVTAGALRSTVEKRAEEINRAKAFCRVGMGRCQGRLCAGAAAEILAAARGVELPAVGRLRGQPPVKPLAVGLL